MADIREQLLAAFELEQSEHMEALRAALARARAGEPVNFKEAFRRAHSLKGAARAVDASEVEAEAHALEQVFADALESGALAQDAIEPAARRLDAIGRAVDAMYRGVETEGAGSSTAEFVRVDAAQIQALSRAMHEMSADLGMIDAAVLQLRDLKGQAEALAQFSEVASAKVDAAELRRDLAAIVTQGRHLARQLATAARQQGETAWAANQAATRVRGQIERVSMAPASSVFAGLDLMMRELAQEAGREINFRVTGLDAQADRRLLQSLRDPVIHLLRNAVAHGIEAPQTRAAAGKPAAGEVELAVVAQAGRLIISVRDDGRGPDLDRIEAAAIASGLIGQREIGQSAPEALLSLAFEAGLSTAGAVDRIAGRGMGLSVVAEAARAAGGEAHMRRRYPWGTEIVLSTPLSTAHQAVLLGRDGGEVFALPAHLVERVVRMSAHAIQTLDGRQVVHIEVEGNPIVLPFVALLDAVGAPSGAREEADTVQIAVLRQGEQRLGVSAEAFEDVRAATITALGGDEVILGAIDLGGGAAAVVIDAAALLQRYARNELDFRAPAPMQKSRPERITTILVVDDSITTRTLEKSILEAQGYRVIVTVDGVDALEVLHTTTQHVDLIVADIEMPRMDGFQLVQALKNDAQLSVIPVILMTSRADPEDVRRGLDLGADAYLVKQNFDQRELLATIGQLL